MDKVVVAPIAPFYSQHFPPEVFSVLLYGAKPGMPDMESIISLARPIAMTSGALIIASVAVEITAVSTPEAMAGGGGLAASGLALAGVSRCSSAFSPSTPHSRRSSGDLAG